MAKNAQNLLIKMDTTEPQKIRNTLYSLSVYCDRQAIFEVLDYYYHAILLILLPSTWLKIMAFRAFLAK